MNSTYNTSANTDTFRTSMTFYVPATEFEKHVKESPVWKLGNVGKKNAGGCGGLLSRGGDEGEGSEEGEGEEGEEEKGGIVNGDVDEEEDLYDGPEKLLLRTKYLTDPGSRDTDELRAWASSAPEMKDVSFEMSTVCAV